MLNHFKNVMIWSTLSHVPKCDYSGGLLQYLRDEKNMIDKLRRMFDLTNFTILVQMPENAKGIELNLPGMNSKTRKAAPSKDHTSEECSDDESGSDESGSTSTVLFGVSLFAAAVVGSYLLYKWQQQK
jgi:uncharacterized protein HemX